MLRVIFCLFLTNMVTDCVDYATNFSKLWQKKGVVVIKGVMYLMSNLILIEELLIVFMEILSCM